MSNSSQLKNIKIVAEKSDESHKLELMEYDCVKIAELIKLNDIVELHLSFVFMAQAFHWFNYDDFLSKFTSQTQGKKISLVFVSYGYLELTNDLKKIEPFFDEFYETILSFLHVTEFLLKANTKNTILKSILVR